MGDGWQFHTAQQRKRNMQREVLAAWTFLMSEPQAVQLLLKVLR